MPGGPGKINEYNKSLTPEQRKANAKRAGSQKRRKPTTIREIARIMNAAPIASDKAREQLRAQGIEDENLINAAMIAASVFRAAVNGNMNAVEKWEKYVGEVEAQETDNGKVEIVIDV